MSRPSPAVALPGLAAALLAGALAVQPVSAPAAEMTPVRLVAEAGPLVPERSPDNDEGDVGSADGSSRSDRSDFGLSSGGSGKKGDEQQDILEGESGSGKPRSSGAQGGGKHSGKDDEGDGGSWIGKLLDSIFSGIAKALG
ncbi:hypothetical protein GCM10023321_74670 [Pseudonocardia eucalypti]|uniref:Uncharacterized protein n=1 Tax=Pseudonocardia eucalypti TaxID=648755 RepID=A0ABP9R940_9PSEU|nr:hypothetical protein [Pseudonocardia eucalypti]